MKLRDVLKLAGKMAQIVGFLQVTADDEPFFFNVDWICDSEHENAVYTLQGDHDSRVRNVTRGPFDDIPEEGEIAAWSRHCISLAEERWDIDDYYFEKFNERMKELESVKEDFRKMKEELYSY